MTATRISRVARQRAATRNVVVIYVRVSTDEQARSGLGIDAQIAECRAYAVSHGWTVGEVVAEDAVSGKVAPATRPGFARAVELLDLGLAGTLLVRRTDRISRNLRHFLAVVDRADDAEWSIATTDGKVDTATAAGRLHVNMMASFAEYEREVIGERTREALAAKKAAGARLGHPSKLPSATLARIVEQREAGEPLAAIADRLNADGLTTATGLAWTWKHVQRALRTAALDLEAARVRCLASRRDDV